MAPHYVWFDQDQIRILNPDPKIMLWLWTLIPNQFSYKQVQNPDNLLSKYRNLSILLKRIYENIDFVHVYFP